MPATTDYQGSFLGRISIRRNQVTAVDGGHDQELEDLELFQKHVGDRFSELLSSSEDPNSPDPLLSISWLRKLLDVFLCCEAEFKALVIMERDPSQVAKSPLDRVIPDLMERMVKALVLCNAVTSGIEAVKSCQKFGKIVVYALEQKALGNGQVRRAKNWSAAKQIQAMTSNLAAPKGADAMSLASPVYVMSTVIVFVTWALVAAIPCQDWTGLTMHFRVPKQLGWANSLFGLHEKIGEEWKRKEKKGTAGLLEEMQKMEKLVHNLTEFLDSFNFSGEPEKLKEAARHTANLSEVCKKMINKSISRRRLN